MAKVACVKDYLEYARMIAALVREEGHEALAMAPPVDFDRLLDFGPQVLVIGLFRQRCAFNRPIQDLPKDVLGLVTLRELEAYPAIRTLPLIVLGNGIEEHEVPTTMNYDLYLFFPDDMHLFLPKLDEVAAKVKSRRTISPHVCPACGSRLTFTGNQDQDLFCPRCGVAVAIINRERCIARNADGLDIPCSLDRITPPGRRR